MPSLFATISGREQYTDPGEKFENVTMLLYRPVTADDAASAVQLIDARGSAEMAEDEYFRTLRQLHNDRNPHAQVGVEGFDFE